MSCKSAIYTVNNSLPTVNAAGTIPAGTTLRRFGCNLTQSGTGIEVTGGGYYQVNVSASLSPTAAGTAMISLFRDGAVVPGATAAETMGTAGDTVNLNITAIIRVQCCESATTLTVVFSGVTSALINNMAITVEKL